MRDVATEAIGMKIENVGRAEQLRISNSLRTLGFDRKGVFTSGPAKGCARFLRPASGEPAMPPGTEF